jgi:hypothetical protein
VIVAGKLAAVDQAIRLLAEVDDPPVALIAAALRRWRSDGETLESALGLPTDWRWRERMTKRDRALRELVQLRPGVDATAIAREIACASPGCIRPDGAAGHIHDLAGLGLDLSERHLRRLVAGFHGQQASCNGHEWREEFAPGGTDAKETDS